jgi:hypothetical protein
LRKKGKPALVPILILTVVGIWGYNLYNLSRELTSPADTTGEAWAVHSRPVQLDSVWFEWEYPDSLRDPFTLAVLQRPATHEKLQLPAENMLLPPFRFTGLMRDKQGALAVLQTPQRATVFLRQGRLSDSLIARQINDKSITLLYRGKLYTLNLQESSNELVYSQYQQ